MICTNNTTAFWWRAFSFVCITIGTALAFTPRILEAPAMTARASSILFYRDPDYAEQDELDRVRMRLEEYFAIDRQSSILREGIIAEAKARHMFLTSTGRSFRELEIELLQSLENSDDALDELVHLWTTEKDKNAAAAMLHMQKECSEGLVDEEAMLEEMTRQFPGWAEPHSRLAMLLFHQGVDQLPRAAEMAERAIGLKPWHFEALQLLVVLNHCLKDPKKAMRYRRLSLPPLSAKDNNRMRKKWVNDAMNAAAQLWGEAEHTTNRITVEHATRFLVQAEHGDYWG
ncbi:hypothetical protein FisN_15Hh048 [Fistulifera solaris]|uniref:Tetratricopeptide repeat protein n=1 Tax=Fistulifera solaris TaxID=1519565 RepID=A0A1Z5KA60_FISSO|nr:hypothetical protein FisN_15Hh048 [Fistulifera solaris]|eukprot:GAX23052.1 hypothetical protein FisN_15Hh048 [Fistulifera solaris]